GVVLLLRGRAWTLRATQAITERMRGRGRQALAFFVSFTQLLVPFLGLYLIAQAIGSTRVLGPLGEDLLFGVVELCASVLASLWLAGRLFPTNPAMASPIVLPSERRGRARRIAVGFGTVVGLVGLVETVTGFDEVDPASKGVLVLPIYILLSLLFWRLTLVFKEAREAALAEDPPEVMHARLLATLIPALRVVAVAGPVLAAAGYLNAVEALMVPTALTLGLFGLLQALQVPIRDGYAAITRTDPEMARQALLPVLVNFALVLGALPIIALLWGTRPAELAEFFTRFNEGVAIGEVRVTPGTLLSILLVFGIGLLATRLIQSALKATVLPRTGMDAGARNALSSGVGYVGVALAALLAINAGGIDLTALGFVVGALSVGIGFGLQNVVSNFVSGIILLIERPISEGDWIEVGGNMGIVKDISVRSTVIETFDKQQVIVPNADFISGTVTNWTRGNSVGRLVMTVGVAYGTDTRRVAEILREIADGHPDIARVPEPGIDFLGFGADSLDFRIRAILPNVNLLLTVQTEVHHQIAERFVAEGIEIPFAQRDIWLRNPEVLKSEQAFPTIEPGAAT
ncbi:MAG: mechanosensitive ion channel domain-containing protein, partial [Pseudomonadota bacterium]